MAKYYINQKLSFKDRFTIKDANMKDVFMTEGKFFSLGKQIMISTMAGEELLFIKQKVWTLLSQFEFFIGDEKVSEMKQEFSFFKKRYNIISPNWQITGDIWDYSYEIKEGNDTIARIQRKFFSLMDAYEIDVLVPEYTELIIGIVIAIDADLSNEGNN